MTEAAPLRRDRRPSRTSATAVLGDVLMTVGVVVLLFVTWQLWIGDLIIGAERNAEGRSITEGWAAPPAATSVPRPAPAAEAAPGVTPVVVPQPADGETFGVLRVPRWGADYRVPVAGGVSRSVTLDPIGVGHYPDTAMPGEAGNFALAGHRTTYGAPFANLQSLVVGDAVVVETADGWYTYRFRNLQYVGPSDVDVLLPMPQVAGSAPEGSYLTMTTCSPRHSAAERLIAYGVFESFTPRPSGAPSSLVLAGGV